MLFLRLLAVVVPVGATFVDDFKPPRVVIDLDQDPEHRWDEIIAGHKQAFLDTINFVLSDPRVKKVLPYARRIVGNALEGHRLLTKTLYLEAKGAARALGIQTADLVILESFYDLATATASPLKFPACAGIIAQTQSGDIIHGRNLDYSFAEKLRSATIVVDYKRNGTVLFTSVSMGPTPGFNTAVRYGAFSVTQNERDRGHIWDNLWDVLIRGRPAIFSQIREAMETISTFQDAAEFFKTSKLDAAAYFIVAGMKAGEGVVITRGRDAAADVWPLDAASGRWYLVETNYDRSLPGPYGDDRWHPLVRGLNATGQKRISPSAIFDVLSTTKVNRSAGERAPLNRDTIYTTVMQASRPETFMTVVRTQPAPPLQNIMVV